MKRVVTGVDYRGQSVVLTTDDFTELSPWLIEYDPRSEVKAWIENINRGGPVQSDSFIPRTAGSVRINYVVFPPGLLTAEAAGEPGVGSDGFHTTRTIDFLVILSGEIKLILDNESVVLKVGDFVIQQATRHAWLNESSAPVIAVFVMLRPGYAV